MSSSTLELTTRARVLRSAAPQQYNDFCKAFSDYAALQLVALLAATDNLPLAQGHAQQCNKLVGVLNEAKNG